MSKTQSPMVSRRGQVLLLTGWMISSCFLVQTPAIAQLQQPVARQPVTGQTTRPAVAITFVEMRYRRPPLISLFFNVTLRNQAPEPRWFVLPTNLNLPPGKGVDGVEIYQSRGRKHIVLGRFLGTNGFQAILLPARATVTLKNLSIAYWGELPKNEITLEVVTAKQLMLGNDPIQKWFADAPMSDAQTEGDMTQFEVQSTRSTPNGQEVPVVMLETQRIQVKVKPVKQRG